MTKYMYVNVTASPVTYMYLHLLFQVTFLGRPI